MQNYGRFVLARALGNTLIVPPRKELNPLYLFFNPAAVIFFAVISGLPPRLLINVPCQAPRPRSAWCMKNFSTNSTNTSLSIRDLGSLGLPGAVWGKHCHFDLNTVNWHWVTTRVGKSSQNNLWHSHVWSHLHERNLFFSIPDEDSMIEFNKCKTMSNLNLEFLVIQKQSFAA